MKRIGILWCELEGAQPKVDLLNFSREMALAVREYADLILDGRAGQRHECEDFKASNGVRVMITSASWNGERAPHEECPHCSQSER